ncbi:MAG: dethiobiotin synthase [Pseudomonadales bacterium]
MSNGFFVTGTDTDVGKTLVACSLLRLLRRAGYSTAAVKPVAAGCEQTAQGLRNKDALALQREITLDLSYAQINPVALEPAIAPHIAARHAGIELAAAGVAQSCRQVLTLGADYTVIEGAGGWSLLLNCDETLADVVEELKLPVILVVGLRLGCPNHALLTAAAIERSGLTLAAWVGSCSEAQTMSALDENISTLKSVLTAPCIGIIPHLTNATPELAENHLDMSRLMLIR